MINYYLRPGNALVRINTDTKEIVNILNLPIQKTISKLDNEQYYNTIVNEASSWPTSDEQTFNSNYQEVLSILSNL